MLKIVKKTTPIKLDSPGAKALQGQLQGRFNSLLAGVRLEYVRRLGLEDFDLTAPVAAGDGHIQLGEIFLLQPGSLGYVRYEAKDEALEACAISTTKDVDLEAFFVEISSCITKAGLKAKAWVEPDTDSSIPEDAELVSIKVSEKELEAAQELMKSESRSLLHQLASQESILVREVDASGINDLFGLLQHFEDLELIRKDYAVIDQKTGQQILRVPSRASLEEASQKFFIGGTAISNDNVDEVISCTPFCRHLLSGDTWLLLLLLGTLKGLDLESDNVYACLSESAPSRVFLETSQQKFLLVLSNRRLSLDDAYLVGSQIAAYGLKDIIVISTDRTSTLMRHHLHQTNPEASFSFIDTLSELGSQLSSILLERQRAYLRDALDPLADLTPVRVQDLIVRKMVPQPSDANLDQHEQASEDSIEESLDDSTEDSLDDSHEESSEEIDNPARRIADSFEAPAPDTLPAFHANPSFTAHAPAAPIGIQIEMPQLHDQDPPITEEPFPTADIAVPDLPPIVTVPEGNPHREEALPLNLNREPHLELTNLPEPEELIPDLPQAALRSEF